MSFSHPIKEPLFDRIFTIHVLFSPILFYVFSTWSFLFSFDINNNFAILKAIKGDKQIVLSPFLYLKEEDTLCHIQK